MGKTYKDKKSRQDFKPLHKKKEEKKTKEKAEWKKPDYTK